MTNPSSKTVGERPDVYLAKELPTFGGAAPLRVMSANDATAFMEAQASEIESKDEQIAGLEQRLREEQVSHQSTMQALREAEASNASLVERVGKLEKLLGAAKDWMLYQAPKDLVDRIEAALAPAEEKQA